MAGPNRKMIKKITISRPRISGFEIRQKLKMEIAIKLN